MYDVSVFERTNEYGRKFVERTCVVGGGQLDGSCRGVVSSLMVENCKNPL